jgi:hypothetical protein
MVLDQQSVRWLRKLRQVRKECRTATKRSLAAADDVRSDADDDAVVLLAGETDMENTEEEGEKRVFVIVIEVKIEPLGIENRKIEYHMSNFIM